MELPISCRNTLDALIESASPSTAALRLAVEQMTTSYKEASGRGNRLVTDRCAVLAYAATRMPATFGAVSTAIESALQTLDSADAESISAVLDIGAGTGAATLAAHTCLPGEITVTAIEREKEMIAVGQKLTADCNVSWVQADAAAYVHRLAEEHTVYDMVLASYMTNELTDEVRRSLFADLWRITGKLLVIIEPGTKVGSAILRNARGSFSELGAAVCAPCPSITECPLSEDDWCHFTCRVARSKLHKALKGGDVPYEDEKFSYLALTRLPFTPAENRVLRHPQKEAGRITLTLCSPDGWNVKTVTKRDKAAFTAARKANAGDSLSDI